MEYAKCTAGVCINAEKHAVLAQKVPSWQKSADLAKRVLSWQKKY
jgi:hypothetical protein